MSEITEADIRNALHPIIDPDFGRSIVDLGFVKNISIDGDRVSFDIELTTPACPVKEEFQRDAKNRVSALAGVAEVDVRMTAQTRGRAEAENAEILPGVRNTIAVASGKGGVGKSTVADQPRPVALRADRQRRVGVMDADVYGPSLPLLTWRRRAGRATEERDGQKAILPHEAARPSSS